MARTWQKVYAEWLRYHNWARENRQGLEANGVMKWHVERMQELWKEYRRLLEE